MNIGNMLPAIDVSSVEAFIAGLCTIAIFAIPLLINVYKVAHDALAQIREVKPKVESNTRRIDEHQEALDGGLDERISSQVQAVVSANGIGAGNNASPGAMPTVREEPDPTGSSG